MLFRVVMVTTLLFVNTYVEAVSETLLAVNPLYFVIVVTYALTLLYAAGLRLLPGWLAPQVYVQLAGDLLTITALVYVTGGVRTGFLLLYPLSVLSSSLLLPRAGRAVAGGPVDRALRRTGARGSQRAACARRGSPSCGRCRPARSSTRSSCWASPARRSASWAATSTRACSMPAACCTTRRWRWRTCGS